MKSFLSRGSVKIFLKFGFAFGLIYYLVQSGHLDFSLFLRIENYWFLALAIVFSFANLLAVNFRWGLFLWNKGFKTSPREVLNLTLMGVFFNFTLPSSVGGDAVKAFYLAKDNQSKKMLAYTSVLVDRLIGLFAMVAIGAGALVFNLDFVLKNPDLTKIMYLSLLILGLMSLGLIGVFSKTVKNLSIVKKILLIMPGFINKIYDALNSYGESKALIFKTIGLSFLVQTFAISFMVSLQHAMGFNLPLGVYFFAVPVGYIIMSIPISPGGIGVGQLAFLTLFQLYLGESTQFGQLAITAFQVVLFCWGLIGAYQYAKRKDHPALQED